jgi:hypothetical protein
MPEVHLIIKGTIPDFPDSSEETVLKGYYDKAKAEAEAIELESLNRQAVALNEKFRKVRYPPNAAFQHAPYEPLLPRIKFPKGMKNITQEMRDKQKQVQVENQQRTERNKVIQQAWNDEQARVSRTIAESLTNDAALVEMLLNDYPVPCRFMVQTIEVE